MKKHFKKLTALVVIGFFTIFGFAHLGEASTQKFSIGGKNDIVRAEVKGPVKYKLKNKTTKIYSNARIYNKITGNYSNSVHRYSVAVQKKILLGLVRNILLKTLKPLIKVPNQSARSKKEIIELL
ncbi:hypothetical protein [Bacillus pumilus]|uniref:hypothetical protein n=1 Tax=Bacillus pumilus TaxID=1408 RepID=UPI003D70B56E